MSIPRIDIIIIRIPDEETQLTVYIDGVETEVNEWHFDPGAGYTPTEWEACRQHDTATAPSYLTDELNNLYNELSEHI